MRDETPKKPAPKFERGGLPTAVLDVHEAAAYLAVKEATVYELVRAGELPHTRVGRSLRFRVADLDRYLAERTSREWRPHHREKRRA
jgi:excisionase family DNA binding protein